ncbi:DUF4926 domain-containing protein (plasmid) [Methylobacterium fujisawaense]|jgi:Domain of unknown function (DUF4926)|uniref:DUF4926 domain-containing protein n=1 Tax=Methylobacterium fujisawaense TaxID=107400 RepID=UPI000B0C5C67
MSRAVSLRGEARKGVAETATRSTFPSMSVEAVYQYSADAPGAEFRELDDVRVLIDVTTMDGDTIAAGTEGTVVAVWKGGAAYEIEFPEPMGALATVKAGNVELTRQPT